MEPFGRELAHFGGPNGHPSPPREASEPARPHEELQALTRRRGRNIWTCEVAAFAGSASVYGEGAGTKHESLPLNSCYIEHDAALPPGAAA